MKKLILLALLTLSFSACGATNGNFTVGTTSYLKETNYGKLIMREETYKRYQRSQ